MTTPNPALDQIESQLDLIDRAVAEREIDGLRLPSWAPPPTSDPVDAERLALLLARIEETIHRVGGVKREIAEAHVELLRRRHLARLYTATSA